MQVKWKLSSHQTVTWLKSAVLAGILCTLLYFAGTLSGEFVLRLQRDYRLEVFNRAFTQQGIVVQLFSGDELQQITNKYIGAILDATINFEMFPQKKEAEMFISLVSVLPGKVSIEKFEFSGSELFIHCSAQTTKSLYSYREALIAQEPFRRVDLSVWETQEGSFQATITAKYR